MLIFYKDPNVQAILSKIKTEPNIEESDFNSTKKRDDLKSQYDAKNNSPKTNRNVRKRKRPCELSLDIDLAGTPFSLYVCFVLILMRLHFLCGFHFTF